MPVLPPADPDRRRTQRRSPYGQILFAHLRDADGAAVSFDELARAAGGSGARVSDVASWIARASAGGVLEDAGYARDGAGNPVGPRRFRLARTPFRRGDRRGGARERRD